MEVKAIGLREFRFGRVARTARDEEGGGGGGGGASRPNLNSRKPIALTPTPTLPLSGGGGLFGEPEIAVARNS